MEKMERIRSIETMISSTASYKRRNPSASKPMAPGEKSGREGRRGSSRSRVPLGVLVRRDNGQGFRIQEEVVIIGRNYDCDIRIEKPYVSRVHAVVCRENGCLVLEDLAGRNGTWVNRVAVDRKVLADGDRIHIGRAELVFRAGL